MKNIFESILFSAFLIASAAFTFLPIDHYVVSSGYTIGFVSADPSGSFTSMSGDIYFDDADLVNSKFNLSIDVSTISTGNGMRNKKAQTSEWFNATRAWVSTANCSSRLNSTTIHSIKCPRVTQYSYDCTNINSCRLHVAGNIC